MNQDLELIQRWVALGTKKGKELRDTLKNLPAVYKNH